MSGVQSITQRLDNLPLSGLFSISGHYWGLLMKTGFGWAMDSMDTFLFTYLGTNKINADKSIRIGFMAEINASAHEKGLLGASAFAGSLFGSFIFGQLADVYGRKNMFMVTLLIFMIATLLCGAANNVTSMLIFRFIAGFGLGGELPVASALVQEMVPTAVRGRIIVVLESFWSIGCMFAVLMAFELTKAVSWRSVFYISVIPALWAVVIRLYVPESPKWLAAHGRMGEAEAVLEKIETAHGVTNKKTDEVVETHNAHLWRNLNPLTRFGVLFRGELFVRTLVLWTVWTGIAFSYYAIYIWLPIARGTKEKGGYNINGSTWDIFFIVFWQFPGYVSASYLVEIIGRKYTLLMYLIGAFASALAFGYVENTKFNLLCSGAFMSWFMLGAWGALYAYTPENYPTSIRATGCSCPGGISRIGAIAGTYVMPILFDANWTSRQIMWVAGGVPLMFISIVLLVFGFETRGKDLEACPRVEEYLKTLNTLNEDTIVTPVVDDKYEMK